MRVRRTRVHEMPFIEYIDCRRCRKPSMAFIDAMHFEVCRAFVCAFDAEREIEKRMNISGVAWCLRHPRDAFCDGRGKKIVEREKNARWMKCSWMKLAEEIC